MYIIRAGICPHCDSTNLKYKEPYFDDDNCIFPFVCEDCKQEGKEYYYLEFCGIENEDGDYFPEGEWE